MIPAQDEPEGRVFMLEIDHPHAPTRAFESGGGDSQLSLGQRGDPFREPEPPGELRLDRVASGPEPVHCHAYSDPRISVPRLASS